MKETRRRRTCKLAIPLVSHVLLTSISPSSSLSSQLSPVPCIRSEFEHINHQWRCQPGSYWNSRCREPSRSALLGGVSNSERESDTDDFQRTLGLLVLFTVPAAWGTFEPAVRYVYALEPPIPSLLFTVGYYSVASVSLLLLVALSSVISDSKEIVDDETMEREKNLPVYDLPVIMGGLELGAYLFLGNGLQVLGLKTVNADRAAFLLQLTTIMIPLLQAFAAGNVLTIPKRTWIACVAALAGVAVMSLDGQEIMTNEHELSAVTRISQGDVLIVLAAFSYSLHCIRLSQYAKRTTAIRLASTKAATETLLSGVLLIGVLVAGNYDLDSRRLLQGGTEARSGMIGGNHASGGIMQGVVDARNEIVSFSVAISDGISSGSISTTALLPVAGAILWTGLVTIAWTITAQSYGQKYVSPSDANLVYTMQPIFTALFAWLLLGETLGTAGFIGGTLIGLGVCLVASNDESIVLKDT